MFSISVAFLLFALPLCSIARVARREVLDKIVLTNDDGWAEAQIRYEYDALKSLGYQVVLSAPAVDKSGTGSSTAEPTPLTKPCQYDTCPTGSPGVGFNASDPFLNYVNAFPADAARYGIQTLAHKLLGSRPDFVFAGVNVGNNLAGIVNISGTVNAAAEAAREGFASVAFSGATSAHVSYTTLESDPLATSSIAAGIYTNLSLKFIEVLLNNPTPLLPSNTSINVNYPPIEKCNEAKVQFVFTRLLPADPNSEDIHICGSEKLPDEESVFKIGCYATVSVFDVKNKGDAPAHIQEEVYNKIQPLLTCLPPSSP